MLVQGTGDTDHLEIRAIWRKLGRRGWEEEPDRRVLRADGCAEKARRGGSWKEAVGELGAQAGRRDLGVFSG